MQQLLQKNLYNDVSVGTYSNKLKVTITVLHLHITNFSIKYTCTYGNDPNPHLITEIQTSQEHHHGKQVLQVVRTRHLLYHHSIHVDTRIHHNHVLLQTIIPNIITKYVT